MPDPRNCTWHSYQNSIIDEVLYRIKCFIASHSANVQILVKVGFMRVNGLSGFLTDTV